MALHFRSAAPRRERDFRSTPEGRRHSWYGTKRHVKRVLGTRLPHLAMRGAVRVAAPGLRASGRLPAPARLTEVAGHADGAHFVMLRPADCVIAKELYWGRGHRPQPADDLAVRMFAALARDAAHLLDIGAYTGLFTLVGTAANEDLRAHAFEMVPEVYRALFDNCVRNRVLHRTTLHHVGVGPPDTTVAMPARSGDAALPCYYSSGMEFADGVPVRVVALDSFAGLPGGGRVLLKVDVEGTEAEVFAHGRAFMAEHRPDVLCEVLPDADAERLSTLLEPLGYRFHLVGTRALAPAGELVPDPRFRDWLFTTRTTAELRALGVPVAGRETAPGAGAETPL
ncbi:FkbM family methyltransferase [Nocardiopsis sp. RSe5-2]|uniref:FkbM family methyltransferase n=1 Tax=Nocardiopsis endophytica TaxID=3018445 RepID=A0ABT4UE77_9ACTN|nr:FkbM family methyltransferase [Nocardiopsis endophytica]MDA2815290.1 FkbM family methyltransferase [Nocardiopsis endophytica]